MPPVLPIVLPIFALILAGWAARRIGALGENATRELNRFVVYLALPALLFDIVASARWEEVWRPDFVGAFGLGCAVVFVLTLMLRLRRGLADAAIDGLNAAYANTGFMGFPLVLAVLGQGGLTPTLIATLITVCVVFAGALVLVEVGLQAEKDLGRTAAKVAISLARNPLIVAPLLGAVFLGFGVPPPKPVESFLDLLGGAASPCALVALGLFLAEKRQGAGASPAAVGFLVGLKLVVHPLVTWLLATQVFHLDPLTTHAAVLLAALPTGTGPFMVAELYRREAGVTSRVILVSTVLSLLTITAYLSLAL